ncbi:MAG: aminotransferase class V-fold PLP-dependent enzyme [Dehalococcoidales bacterium]|nr:aminotransferase class V-fold PLP-dependent enzyme [Dehalococcoidales bacterium]
MIYLDNAATSWPKPPEVLKAMTDALEQAGGNPGRSGHRLSIAAARVIYDAREEVANFFGASDPLRLIFTSNSTHALNIAIKGLLKPGDKVVTSSIEHNSVMRPLRELENIGLNLHIVRCQKDGSLNVEDIAGALDRNTRLVVLNHSSNVMGTILPVAEVAEIAHRFGALLLVDASQSAGAIPVDIKALGIDLLAFTGHKNLMGPPGIGGLVIADTVDTSQIEPLICGGTGSQSELEEQPEHLPDKYESGTPNIAGVAGLQAGVHWLSERGIEAIRAYKKELLKLLLDGLRGLPGVSIYGTQDVESSTAIISFTITGKRVSDLGLRLDEEFGILSRVGLHCAPAAHRTIGTFHEGTVRLSPGIFTTVEDIQKTVQAIERLSKE